MKLIHFNKTILLLITLGLFLKIIVMVSTIHTDIGTPNYASYLISQKGMVFSFYDYWQNLNPEDPFVKIYNADVFNYPPLLYMPSALFMKIFGGLYPWDLFKTLIFDMEKVFGNSLLPQLLFMLKSPLLVFDFLGLFLIVKIFDDKKSRFLAFVFWLFNPLILYSSYMMAQNDILISFSILSAIYFNKIGKKYIGVLSLGLGGLVKMFPLLLLPIFALVVGSTWKEKFKLFFAGFGIFIIGSLPYLGSQGFRRYALLANQSDKMLFSKIPVSGAEYLPLFVVGLIFLFWLSASKPNLLKLWQWFFITFLLFFSLTHFHPNWFVWISAPLIIFLVTNWPKNIFPVLALFVCFLLIVFLFDSSLNFGLFKVFFPQIANLSFRDLIIRFYEPNAFSSIVRGIFAATSIFIAVSLFQRTKESA